MAEMPECPDCGGYDVRRCAEYDDRDGTLVYTYCRCAECGAEWIAEDDDEPDEEA